MRTRENARDHEAVGGYQWRLIRRLAHGSLSFSAIYYLLPDPLPLVELPKWLILIAAVTIVVLIETWRLARKKLLPGMRPYEIGRIASYAYAVLGVATVLIIAPLEVGIPCIIAMAWADPVAGEIRLASGSVPVTALVTGLFYASLSLLVLRLLGVEYIDSLILVAVTAPIAVISESVDFGGLDDDFTMLFFPSLGGTLAWLLLMG